MPRYEILSMTHIDKVDFQIDKLPAGNELSLNLTDQLQQFGTDLRPPEGLSPLQKQLAGIYDDLLIPAWNNVGYEGSEHHFRGFYTHPKRSELDDNADYPEKGHKTDRIFVENFNPDILEQHLRLGHNHINFDENIIDVLVNPFGYTTTYFAAYYPQFTVRKSGGIKWRQNPQESYSQPGVMVVLARFGHMEERMTHAQQTRSRAYKNYIEPLDRIIDQLSAFPQKPTSPLLTPPQI